MKTVRYSNFVNLSGLFSKKPIKCKYSKRYDGYWDTSGNVDAPTLGLVIKDGMIQFSSTSQKEVELWTSGADSVMKMIRRWST